MAEAIVMPKLGLTMQTGTVTQWNVSEGERVTAGSAVAEITTEKITYVLEAPAEGVLLKIVVPVDGEAPIGATIGIFGQLGEDIASFFDDPAPRDADASAPSAPGAGDGQTLPSPYSGAGSSARVVASPAAKKRAAELGIDLSCVSGTGPGGRVTIDDVDLAAEGDVAPSPAAPPPPTPPAPEAAASAVASWCARAPGSSSRPRNEPVAMTGTAPTVTTYMVRADAQALVELVETFNAHRAGRDDISITAAVVKAVAATLRERSALDVTCDGKVNRQGNGVDVGVAVALARGVTVGVVQDAGTKSLGEVSREIAALGLRARENAPWPEEMPGGVFMVADMTGYGAVDWSTHPIYPGEGTILSVGRIVDDVVAIDGSPTVRPTVGLSLAFDHRAIDQASAGAFLAVLLDHLAHPVRMLA